jgi:osmotically inducible lipoprotein OsmB
MITPSNHLTRIVGILALTAALGACSHMSAQSRDTAVGATAGAVLGGVLTGTTTGAAAGAAVGGIVGSEATHRHNRR